MGESDGPKFKCAACGREFRWKPELAGKKAKCKCGAAVSVPQTAPGAAVAEEDPFDVADVPEPITRPSSRSAPPPPPPIPAPQQLACPICSTPAPPTAVLCTACGYNFRTGQHLPGAGRGKSLAYATKGAGGGGISADTYAQAAKAAWILPLLTCGLGCCTSGMRASSPAIGMAIGGFQLLLILAGLGLGIFALVGVSKHGASGILFPAIAGLVLNVAVIGLIVFLAFMIASGRMGPRGVPGGGGGGGGGGGAAPMPPRTVPVVPRSR
jgi:hypothetical protein